MDSGLYSKVQMFKISAKMEKQLTTYLLSQEDEDGFWILLGISAGHKYSIRDLRSYKDKECFGVEGRVLPDTE